MSSILDLRKPVRSERRRGFQPPWYTVNIYRCDACQKETAVRVSWRGGTPPGGIYCSHCPKAES